MFSILVVDDEPDNFDVIETLLSNYSKNENTPLAKSPLQIHYAASGAQALTSLEILFNPFHQSQSGRQSQEIEFKKTKNQKIIGIKANQQEYRILKEMKGTIFPTDDQPTTILALTASAFKEEQDKIIAVGCNNFMSKPFREKVFFEKMQQYLGIEFIYEVPKDEIIKLISEIYQDHQSFANILTNWVDKFQLNLITNCTPKIISI